MRGLKFVVTAVLLGSGFMLGTVVQAGTGGAGSMDDPLAARSYVQQAVGDKVGQLEQQAQALQQRVTELNQEIILLENILADGAVLEDEKP